MVTKSRRMLSVTGIHHNVAVRSIVIIILLLAVLFLIPDQGYAEQEEHSVTLQKDDATGIDAGRIESRLKEIRELLLVVEAAENEQSASQLGTREKCTSEKSERCVHATSYLSQ
jgi:hypothetical protein